jgi:hypothetical protein
LSAPKRGIELGEQLLQMVGAQRRAAFQPDRVQDPAQILDMGVVGLAGAVADPQEVAGRADPGLVELRRILARQRLLVAQQQGLVAGEEIGGLHLRMVVRVDAAGAHERDGRLDARGDLLPLRRRVDKIEHPLVHIAERGVAAAGQSAHEIQRGGGLPVGFHLPNRVRRAGLGGEGGTVDDVAPVAGQGHAVDRLDIGGARLGELSGDAADLHDRRRRLVCQHHRHLQEDAEEVADVVRPVLLEALRAIAALQQEGLAVNDLGQTPLQLPAFAGEDERRERAELTLHIGEFAGVGEVRHLLDRLAAPARGGPALGHRHRSRGRVVDRREVPPAPFFQGARL